MTRKYDEDYKAFNRGKKSFSWEKVKFQRYRAEKMLEIWGNKRVTLRKLRGLVTRISCKILELLHCRLRRERQFRGGVAESAHLWPWL